MRIATILACATLVSSSAAQCLEWTKETDLPGFVAAGSPALDGIVRALEVFDDGTPSLAAAGQFANVSGTYDCLVVRWTGNAWAAIPLPSVSADQGNTALTLLAAGNDFYAGGRASNIGFVCRVEAVQQSLGQFFTFDRDYGAEVRALADYAGSVYAAGRFRAVRGTTANVLANSIARYTGSDWEPLGPGLQRGPFPDPPAIVTSLAVFDDGGGAKLYAAGRFGGTGFARWDGASWSHLASVAGVYMWFALTVFDDGSGPALYGAGVGAGLANNIVARFDGVSWSIVGTPAGVVHCLTEFDDGNGDALYAGGSFSSIDGVPARQIAKWNGATWSALGGGIDQVLPPPFTPTPAVYALQGFDRFGFSPALFTGGEFNRAGADRVQNIAAWKRCHLAGTPYCFGDGSLATLCPCAPPDTVPSPSGAPDSGCANSFHASGAKLFASGTTNPDRVRLHGSSQTPAGFSFLISGNGTEPNGLAYGDGVRCAGGTFVRFGAQNATGGAIVYPNVALGLTLPLSTVSGAVPGNGATRYYQALYRDASPAFCGPGTLNLTNAVEIAW